MTGSQQLLAEYRQSGSDAAFRELVTRYVDLVYSTALRLVQGDTHRAQDVAQTVFLDLARRAKALPADISLGGWLHRNTCFVAGHTMRGERRRQSRERQAVEMNALQVAPNSSLALIAPILDEAINELDDTDRTAVLLRFFEKRDFRTVGELLGSSEDAARMRVTRALEKLQSLLKRRGITTTAAALSILLSAHAVQAAPAGLAVTIAGAAAALAGATVASTTAASGAKTLAATVVQKTLIPATLVFLAGLGLYETRQVSSSRGQIHVLEQQQAPLTDQIQELSRQRDNLSNELALLADSEGRLHRNHAELVSLRGELAHLTQENARMRTSLPTSPSFAPRKKNGGGEGDYTSGDISMPRNGVAYSPGQAAGSPDTDTGNLTTAWSPREAQAGQEWLQLEYAQPVDIEAFLVHEAANSGAITKVTAVSPDGVETLLDNAHQESRESPAVYQFTFATSVATAACVRIYFNTTLAKGRVAVDTAQLRGRDGGQQWPIRALASSYYDAEARPASKKAPRLPRKRSAPTQPPATPASSP